jgi:uncharacterized membrane protein
MRDKQLLIKETARQRSDKLVALHMAERRAITRTTLDEPDDATFGERAADAVARFGGSWTFIMLFALVLLAWVGLNSVLLARGAGKPFDPYPYILLNLFLSMLASVQAPLILMSQNRQAGIDRENAQHDYEVNLKAELEIMALHEKIDALKQKQWDELMELQRQQMELLARLAGQPEAALKS